MLVAEQSHMSLLRIPVQSLRRYKQRHSAHSPPPPIPNRRGGGVGSPSARIVTVETAGLKSAECLVIKFFLAQICERDGGVSLGTHYSIALLSEISKYRQGRINIA